MEAWNEEIKKTFNLCGPEVFIGHNTMFFRPGAVRLQGRFRMDPFGYVTCGLEAEKNVQVCSHVVMDGGLFAKVILREWTFVAYGSKLLCGSDDFVAGGPINAYWGKVKKTVKDIEFKPFSGVTSQVIVMPGVVLPEGCVIGANSIVSAKDELLPWHIHAGFPLKPVKARDKDLILRQAQNPNYLNYHV